MADSSRRAKVLLTGGATGIGAATAARLAGAGAEVTILDVAEPQGGAGAFVRCDLSDPAAIDAALKGLSGPWDALVNVAGIPGPRPAEPVIAVNFLGLRHLSQRVLPRMTRGGSVVNVASTAAQNWQRRAAVIDQLLDTADFAAGLAWCRANGGLWEKDPYTFSKQCVVAWTYRAVGAARAHGVRVNAVSPGGTDTRLTENFTAQIGAEQVDWMNSHIGRSATPDDIAKVIAFVAIGDCGWLNGVDIVVDGGMTAGRIGGWIDVSQSPAMLARANKPSA
jgi:NAD(P)-dependent dehydrogenase (short-subunit alcohol dehydrogenase family)